MCCRTVFNHEGIKQHMDFIHEILTVAGFRPEDVSGMWVREFPAIDARGNRKIMVQFADDHIKFSFSPTINQHTVEDHRRAAIMAAIVFNVVAVIGEKLGHGTVIQEALTGVCREEGAVKELASYPSHPMRHESLCKGFRLVLSNGVHQHDSSEPNDEVAGDDSGSAGVPEASGRQSAESSGEA